MSQKFNKIEVDKNEKRFFEDVFEKKKLLLPKHTKKNEILIKIKCFNTNDHVVKLAVNS